MAADGRLYRKRNSALAGVCAGLAEHFDADTVVVRILVVLVSLVTLGFGALVYLIMWAVVPLEPERAIPYEVQPENAMSSVRGAGACCSAGATDEDGAKSPSIAPGVRVVVAVALVVLFFLASFNVAPMVSGTQWWQYWPFAPLIVGLCLIVIPAKGKYEGAWHAFGIVLAAIAATFVPLSVGIVSWATVPLGLQKFWYLIVAAVVLFGFGLKRNSLALMMAGAVCVVIFCLLMLYFCSIPGVVESLVFVMPGGRSFVMMGPIPR